MPLQDISILIFSGACAGFFSGLVGIGAGFMVVPLLIYALPHMGIPSEMVVKMAIGTSMAVTIPTSAASLFHEYRSKRVVNFNFEMIRNFCLPAALGGVAGTLLVTKIDNKTLTFLFLAYMTYASIIMIRPVKARYVTVVGGSLASLQTDALTPSTGSETSVIHTVPVQRSWVDKFPAAIAGLGVGVFSSLVGLGGSTMVTLYLTARRFTIHSASVISISVGLSLGLASTATVVVGGAFFNRIHFEAWIIISVCAVIFSWFGVFLKHKTPQSLLRQIFGFALLLVVAMTLYKTYK